MKNHDKIATRLAIILTKLNASERFTVEDLVEEFSVTKRTIQRDLNERLSYLPIKKENKHYYLEPYYLGKLNYDDIKNFSALSGIKGLFPSLQEDFLKSILDNTVSQAYLVKGHNYEDLTDKANVFKLIETAILDRSKVLFTYKAKKRIVDPYKLLNIKGIWYLAGVEDGVLKTFSFSKISGLEITEAFYVADKEVLQSIKEEDTSWFSNNQTEVVLKVDNTVASYFKRRDILPNQSLVKELEDGGVLISTKVAFDEEVLKLVRYWIPHVTVVSPLRLQKKLEEGLRGYLGDIL
jgi:predicted DNA-binding transcriptional regulator YafY